MNDKKYLNGSENKDMRHPFDLELELVLGKMPRKVSLMLIRHCVRKIVFILSRL